MTTRFGSEKTSISRDEFAEDSLKIVSLPSVENDDSVEEMISPKKQVKSSPFTSVCENDGETIHSDSIEVSFSETSLEETEAMNVECPGELVSVPDTGSTFLEENKVGEEISEISTEDDVLKIEDVTDGCVVSISDMKESLNSEKKGQDSDVQSTVEAEKRILLTEIEDGTTFLEENKELQQIKEISEISTEGDQFRDDVHKIEDVVKTDGCVVSISDMKESLNSQKKGQDSDVQILLEAEKKRLLAEIGDGSIFKKKDDVDALARASDIHKIEKNGKGFKDQHEKVERVRVKDNAFVGRSVNIDLVDDTALFDVVPFYKKGKDHPKRPGTDKDAPKKHKKVGGEKPIDKGNASSIVERNASTKVSDFRNRGEMSGKQLRIMYSRNQMESMRYAHIANQKKLWSDLYAKLLPELVTEYEGLKNHKRESGISILGTKEGMDDLTHEEDYVVKEENTEDNDDYNSILRPAFAVDGEPDFDSGPPEDGLEYLRRVRWEAKRIPNVKVAKVNGSKYKEKEQSVYMPQIPEIPKCPEHLLPVKEWEESLLSDFSHIRLALSQNGSESLEDVLMEIFNKRLHTDSDESFCGVVSEIQGMDSVTRVSKLRKRICLVEKKSGLESSDCKWVVALCASVDTPLDGDTSACLRALLRKCASLRALEVEDEQVIIMANMLITIAGRYFGQME
ncbi:Gemin2/Brr1 [Arabidopsis thaliana x Arabidopsis arenosa]|uniref:Gemin2/Brr1 n=1 Tax=Arabidopsis thaliana x Arabidopsis arenosa TaxID=1240361 RepID=A0A8T2A9E8_9BRAS|nr:Gemin2/Brr1 [Arabidopsis thaliana x Arabidopsis arenosa]